jgi:Raf kinase inhibitor-like YbhB/YbcL family protein
MKQLFLLSVLGVGMLSGLTAQDKPNPYDRLPPASSFTLTSSEAQDGAPFAAAQMSAAFGVPGGKDTSPALAWSGAPSGTKSFVVTMYDPDAPTPSGFWHWMVVDIPATTTRMPSGAGSADGKLLPAGAWQVPNDARMAQYVGAAPPPGNGVHRYFIVVQALDVASLDLPKEATPAFVSFNLLGHILGRAVIVPTAEQK